MPGPSFAGDPSLEEIKSNHGSHMSRNSKLIQAILLVLLVLAAIRLFLTFRERKLGFGPPAKTAPTLDPDYYVTPKKLHPQDLKDAKELTQQPVWVREGYRYAYYAVDPKIDIRHPAGTLGPIEKLEIKDVVMEGARNLANRQVMAVFEKDGKRYAFPIGVEGKGTVQIYSDEMLFIQDPHELYKRWPAEVWKSVDDHQVKRGMNELQASFAIGVGIPEGSGATNPKVVNYPNNSHPVTVTFTDGKATEVKEGK
jgi:hypothetical protein